MRRMAYGSAKAIVAAMEIGGEAVIVRPEQVVALHNAARRMGRRLASTTIWTGEGRKHRIVCVPDEPGALTGHKVQRLPKRNRRSGQFRKDAR